MHVNLLALPSEDAVNSDESARMFICIICSLLLHHMLTSLAREVPQNHVTFKRSNVEDLGLEGRREENSGTSSRREEQAPHVTFHPRRSWSFQTIQATGH